jgi:hypothetical protein
MPRGRRKRPADVIGNAVKVMRIATGQTGGLWTFPPESEGKDPGVRQEGRKAAGRGAR